MSGEDVLAMARDMREREPTARELAARRAARAVQELAERVVLHDADVATLEEVTAGAEALAARLPIHAARSRYGALPDGAATVVHAFETHPVGGGANPFAFALGAMSMDGTGTVRGETSFGPAWEGTPGVAHGGAVAVVFDQLLGAAAAAAGRPMVTGTLTIRYRRPTPIETPLVFTCRLTSVEGRRAVVTGECQAGDVTTAEAEAIFVTVDVARYIRP